MLDEEVEGEVINRVLYKVLKTYRTSTTSLGNDESQASSGLTPELAASLDSVLDLSTDYTIPAISNAVDEDLLKKLEKLLPDPVEDEDGHKSAWDTVIELHGRDMVKANETNPTTEWRVLCLVARLMIHYDFLSKEIA